MTSRFPWPAYTGDRIRASLWLEALAPAGSVTLIAPPGEIPASHRHVRHVVVRRSLARLGAAALAVVLRRLPWQTLLAAGYDWRRAVAEAGEASATVVMLSRLHPWGGSLARGRRLLDAVDSLALSAKERARASGGPLRCFWSAEAARNRRFEGSLRTGYDAIFVISDTELEPFAGGATTLSGGIETGPVSEAARDIDFAFWGRLGYFANEDAARLLLEEVWPRLRAELPQAGLTIAGADAPRWLRKRNGVDGVSVVSPVGDMGALARRVRVALFPVRFGTGQLNKVLEAAAAGCRLVATPRALAGVPELRGAVAAESADELAQEAVALWRDADPNRAEALRASLSEAYGRRKALDRMAAAVHTAITGERR